MTLKDLSEEQRTKLQIGREKLLQDLALVDASLDPIYDRFTDLASKIISAPISLMSMVMAERQFFTSSIGLPEPWASQRQTPISYSFCQHVVNPGRPLIVRDAREDETLKDNLAISDLNVIGYLGIPLGLTDGQTLGSFCVIDDKPRRWTDIEIAIMTELAGIIATEFDARAMAYIDEQYNPQHDFIQKQLEDFFGTYDRSRNERPGMSQSFFLRWVRDWRDHNTI